VSSRTAILGKPASIGDIWDRHLTGLLLAEFLEHLELDEVTLVVNDGAGHSCSSRRAGDARVGRLVLASCETDDNYPPGLSGRVAALFAVRSPPGRLLGEHGLPSRLECRCWTSPWS
jgi:hypothetical protein